MDRIVLKRYLEYAETRGRAVVEAIGNEADSDFEVEVGDRLRAKGYQLDFQVGVSGYKIDLGVRHPDHPETFLAGVECDGARYHSSKSARDRDRLREEVLGGLGWEILRVWSTDWFDNPDLETDKLVGKLERLRSGPPRTFHDYQIVDPAGQVPVSEPYSLGEADDSPPAATVDLEGPYPSGSSSEPPADGEAGLVERGARSRQNQAYKVVDCTVPRRKTASSKRQWTIGNLTGPSCGMA